MGRLDGKVALVTGGSSGIGKAATLALANEGAKTVIVADLNKAGLEETVALAREANCEADYIQLDVSQVSQVESMIERIMKLHGRIDCAVNNAGVEGDACPTHQCTEENWDRVLSIDLKGVWLCMKKEIEVMLKQGSGSIVNMSSAAGLVGLPYWPAYVAAKHGVVGLTKTAALEYANAGIRVNAICPGAVETPMLDRIFEDNPGIESQYSAVTPMGRFGKPDEIAEAIVWLSSDASSFVTGQTIAIDGGFSAH